MVYGLGFRVYDLGFCTAEYGEKQAGQAISKRDV